MNEQTTFAALAVALMSHVVSIAGASAQTITVELDGESLSQSAVSAENNLETAKDELRVALEKHVDSIVAEATPGKNGKSPIDFDPNSGELFVNVRVRIDMQKYRQFSGELLRCLEKVAARKIEVRGQFEAGFGVSKGVSWLKFKVPEIFKPGQRLKPFFVLPSPKSYHAFVFLLDDDTANFAKGILPREQLAVLALINDKHGYELASGAEFASGGEVRHAFGKNSALCSGIITDMGSGLAPAFAIVPCMRFTPSLYDGENRIDILLYGSSAEECLKSEVSLRIRLGTFTAEDLKEIKSLSFKIGHMDYDGHFLK